MSEPITRKVPNLPITEDDVFTRTHFERDNRNVDLYLRVDPGIDNVEHSITSWVDDAVDEAVEDGFLSPKDWTGTAFANAKMHGLIAALETIANERLARIWNVVLDHAASFDRTDIDTDADALVATLPPQIRAEIGVLPYGMQQVLEAEIEEELAKTVGWQIVDATGSNIHGDEDDPFGMTSYSILNGKAIDIAREWVSENPGYDLVRVGPDDIEEPEYLDTIELRATFATPGT